MNIILWIVLGLAAGWLASIVMGTNHRQGMFLDIVLGIGGAIVGGLLMNFLGASGTTGFNLYSLFVAFIGAVALIGVGRAVSRSSI